MLCTCISMYMYMYMWLGTKFIVLSPSSLCLLYHLLFTYLPLSPLLFPYLLLTPYLPLSPPLCPCVSVSGSSTGCSQGDSATVQVPRQVLPRGRDRGTDSGHHPAPLLPPGTHTRSVHACTHAVCQHERV